MMASVNSLFITDRNLTISIHTKLFCFLNLAEAFHDYFLMTIDWSPVLSSSDVTPAVDYWTMTVMKAVASFAPLKVRAVHPQSKPWFFFPLPVTLCP